MDLARTDAASRVDYFPPGNPTRDYIRNCACRFEIRTTGDGQPYVVSIPDGEASTGLTTFLTSASATLLDYPVSTIRSVHQAMTQEPVSSAGRFFRKVASRPKISIGLFNPPISSFHIPDDYLPIVREALPALRNDYPQNPIMIRGLLKGRHGHSFSGLRKLGFSLIPYRRVFLVKDFAPASLRRTLKKDLSSLRKQRNLISDPDWPLPPEEYEKMAELYRIHFLGKFSSINPDYTAAFLSYMHQRGWLRHIIYRDSDGVLAGFASYAADDKMLNGSLIGFDREKETNPSIYILLMAGLVDAAMKRQITCNYGAGAPEFKLRRGGIPDFEIMALHGSTMASLRALCRLGRAMVG